MSRPSNRRGPGRVSVQVARPGGVSGEPDESPSRGRHRSPDADGAGATVAAASLVGAPRHRRARPDAAEQVGGAGLPARSIARVEAARDAASRPTVAARPVPATGASGTSAPASRALEPVRGPAEEAVTDLVARPGRGALPDGPGTGPQPAVLGTVVSAVALVAAVVTAVVAGPGRSHLTLVGVLVVALLGLGTAALGLGRQRPRRTLAAVGVVVGAAAVAASAIPLLTL
jgi:hypothetical protein